MRDILPAALSWMSFAESSIKVGNIYRVDANLPAFDFHSVGWITAQVIKRLAAHNLYYGDNLLPPLLPV